MPKKKKTRGYREQNGRTDGQTDTHLRPRFPKLLFILRTQRTPLRHTRRLNLPLIQNLVSVRPLPFLPTLLAQHRAVHPAIAPQHAQRLPHHTPIHRFGVSLIGSVDDRQTRHKQQHVPIFDSAPPPTLDAHLPRAIDAQAR